MGVAVWAPAVPGEAPACPRTPSAGPQLCGVLEAVGEPGLFLPPGAAAGGPVVLAGPRGPRQRQVAARYEDTESWAGALARQGG